MALLLSNCSTLETTTASTPQPNYYPQSDSINRGGAGLLTPAEVERIRGLAWPQAYADMVGAFGHANRSTSTTDIYLVEGTGQEVWIFYSGDQATGFSVR